MGANISGDDYEANDKEVFQSYRIPPKAYKKKSTANSTSAGSTKSLSDTSQPVSPTSVEFGKLTSFRTGGGGGGNKQQKQQSQQQQQLQPQTRLRAGSIPSGFNRSRRDRPISHPPSVLSPSSSTSSLNLSIVNAAVAAGSPTPSMYAFSNGLVSAPITLMSTHHNHGAGVGGGSSRTNSGYSIGSDSFDFSTTPHAVGTGLGRATYVNGKMVEAGVHGGSSSPVSNSVGGFYMHNNYTVQDFMSYQQQQQQQFLEQQQYEYQQMMILRQQQQQLKLEYEQKQLALLQQQQSLHQNSTQISTPVMATAALPRSSQEYINTQQITGVVLQTKSRRPARNPDRALSSQNLSNGSSGNGHHRNASHAIAIPAPTVSSLQRQPHTSQSSPRTHHQATQSSTSSVNHNNQHHHYSTSPSGSMASSYNGGASSFSSTGSHYHSMLAMTSAASPPSSSSSSLSNPGGPTSEPVTVSTVAATGHGNGASKSTTSLKSSGLSADELAARILPLRRLLGGREYYPDKTLPYLLPCDEQESERYVCCLFFIMRALFCHWCTCPVYVSQWAEFKEKKYEHPLLQELISFLLFSHSVSMSLFGIHPLIFAHDIPPHSNCISFLGAPPIYASDYG